MDKIRDFTEENMSDARATSTETLPAEKAVKLLANSNLKEMDKHLKVFS